MIDAEAGATKTSEVFNAQWYPMVTAIIVRTGGTTHTIKLQGSLDLANWEDVSGGGTSDTKLHNYDADKVLQYYRYYRLVMTANDGTINAWIGCGGA